ncbi:MAG: Gfo/Idh/MocA family protein [Halanaerobiaceae bacterium]
MVDNKEQAKRLGIIGTGRMGQARAESVQKVELLETAWVCSRSRDRGQEFASEYGIDKVITDWQQGCEDPGIDGVIITTPNNLHQEMACKALENDKHVLVEYPLAVNTDQGREIINTARQSKGELHSGLTHRLTGHHQAIENVLPRLGSIGTVISLQCSGNEISRWFDDKERMGNVFVASNIHYIDQLVAWLGKVSWVNGSLLEELEDGLVDRDMGSVMLGFASGVTAYIVYARGWPQPGLGFDRKIIGEEGYLVENGGQIKFLSPENEEEIETENRNSILEDTRLFKNLLLEGKKPPYTPEDDLYAVEIAEAAYESSRQGKRIEM